MDLFTQRRFIKIIQDFREKTGQLPTLKDLESAGFDREQINEAIKLELIEQFYVTLTSGTIVKVYKVKLNL